MANPPRSTPRASKSASPVSPTTPPGQSGQSSRPLQGIAVLVIVAVAVVAIALWSYGRMRAQSEAKVTVSLQLPWLHQAQFAGYYTAIQKGYYAQAGINLDLREYRPGLQLNDEVDTGRATFASTLPLELLAGVDQGKKVQSVAAIYQTSPFIIMAHADRHITTPADFRGKVLGLPAGTEAGVTYSALMGEYGVKPAEATIKTVGFDSVQAFKDNTTDTIIGYRSNEPYLLDQAGLAYTTIRPEQFGFEIYGDILIGNPDWMKQHPELTKRFVQATLKGWDYAINHEDEAVDIVMQYAKDYLHDSQYEHYILNHSIPLVRPGNAKQLGGQQFIPWNRAYQALRSSGTIKTNLDVSQVFTTKYLGP